MVCPTNRKHRGAQSSMRSLITLLSVAGAAGLASRPCPSCGQPLRDANRRRHLAFCAPDLLDPQGWASNDRDVVLRHAAKRFRSNSQQAKIIALRFGPRAEISQRKVAQRASCAPRMVRDTIAGLLHSIPPLPESSSPPLDVLYDDEHLVAVNKLPGVGCTPQHRLRQGSMLNRVIGSVSCNPRELRPVHRLDLWTSGVLLFAKTATAATRLMSQFENCQVSKSYAAICSNIPSAQLITHSICKVDGVDHCERRICQPGETGQIAETALSIVAVSQLADSRFQPCLVVARPEHGRTHQIRVHCASAGAPLMADPVYGDRGCEMTCSIERHALHALSIQFTHPVTLQTLEIYAPLAPDMARAIDELCLVWRTQDGAVRQGLSAREHAALLGQHTRPVFELAPGAVLTSQEGHGAAMHGTAGSSTSGIRWKEKGGTQVTAAAKTRGRGGRVQRRSGKRDSRSQPR